MIDLNVVSFSVYFNWKRFLELFLALTKCHAVKSKLIQYFTNLDYEMNLE